MLIKNYNFPFSGIEFDYSFWVHSVDKQEHLC